MSRKYGNAQTIGSNINQNTYFVTKQIQNCLLTVLADGTIDSVTGAYAAILACESIAKGFVLTRDIGAELEKLFIHTAAVLSERLYKGRIPRVSLLAACFYKDDMIYKRIGMLSAAGHNGRNLSVIEPEAGQISMRDKSVLLCSQGLWQALNEIEIEKLMSGSYHPFKKAQKMAEAVNTRKLKDQKSTVILIVK